ncbi:acyltransferase family protein [Maricaulis maris]|uniref:Glucan biosynthesis protein C n=1 Tax=Maricaulis maris TaxID=74318 RepID=A0A495DMV1_9PROT|nr:acyltransferase family protein [Maricaulis maris]RKR03056.1 glucan biosynthesis protein C [Maricaulis maris]
MPLSPSPRIHALDAVRALALFLGVVLHASMSFIPGIPIWIVQDSQATAGFSLGFFVPHIFRMVLFFMIAGYFAHMALGRRGILGLALDRAKRIALPLAALWMPIFALIVTVVIWGAIKANGGEAPQQETPPLTAQNFPLTHLWFLYMLVIFNAVSLPLTALVRLIDRSDLSGKLIDAITGLLARTPLGTLLLAAPLAIWFITTPMWMSWFGIPTPDTGLLPNTGALIAYGTAFAAGWAAHRCSDLVLTAWKRAWHINLGIAIALTTWLVMELGMTPNFTPVGPGMDRLPVAAAYTLAIWTWTFGLTGAALVIFSRENRVWRYLADASYWVYLMHLPLVMALQVALSDVALPGLVKLPLILAISFAILLGTYQLIVRHTWIGGWLNGRRASKVRSEDARIPADASA